MNTLVVDDELLVRWFFQRSLRKWGHSVFTATGMSEAHTLLDQNTFDTVVIDLRFPDGNGMTLIRELLDKQYEPRQVIVCSAYISSEIHEQLIDMGVVVLRKPFKLEELRHVVSSNN